MTLNRPLRVFLCHSSDDKPAVYSLYQKLKEAGVEPWLDKENLLPGENWRVKVEEAITKSDIIIICLSTGSITKEGFVQKEIRIALDAADTKPEGTIFNIPLKLEECNVPYSLSDLQWSNLWEEGSYKRLIDALTIRANSLSVKVPNSITDNPLPPRNWKIYLLIAFAVTGLFLLISSLLLNNILSRDKATPSTGTPLSINVTQTNAVSVENPNLSPSIKANATQTAVSFQLSTATIASDFAITPIITTPATNVAVTTLASTATTSKIPTTVATTPTIASTATAVATAISIPTINPTSKPTIPVKSTLEFVWKVDASKLNGFSPFAVTVDLKGNVYITDMSDNYVKKFDSSGKFLEKWGINGKDSQAFSSIGYIAVDEQGNVYVIDRSTWYIYKFNNDGTVVLAKWGGKDNQNIPFASVTGIAIDKKGNVYIADQRGSHIYKFDNDGNPLLMWGKKGNGDGEFTLIDGIGVDSEGYIYVGDGLLSINKGRIEKFDSNGKFISTKGSFGEGAEQFIRPIGIAADEQNNLYVTDAENETIRKYTSSGNFLTGWRYYGTNDGEYRAASSIVVDKQGNIYVVDPFNKRVQKFKQK